MSAPAQTASSTESRTRLEVDRGNVVRGAVVLVLLAFVIFAVPEFVGADWITTFTSVAIYSVAALGFGILYGRVGMISLGQVALLTIGVWLGARLACGTGLPFVVLLLLAGGITCVIGVLVGVVQAVLAPYESISRYRSAAPFVLAIIALLYLSRRRVVTISRTAQ